VGPGTEGFAPLYQRLPRGPHHLAPNEVARHQRIRMHGAMVEAVATDGYEGTRVKQVIALAGVSRRAFYEQFANKEECFLATFDLIAARAVKRTNEAYLATEGALENRLRAALEEFAEEIRSGSKGAGRVIVEAQTAGAAGLLHLRRATATFEQMLFSSFANAPEVGALPIPVVRGIVGGLHEVTSIRLRAGRAREIPALTEELLRWTLLFQTSALDRLAARLAARARVNAYSTNAYSTNGHLTNGCATNGYNHPESKISLSDTRACLLRSVLSLTVLDDYRELSVPQIADEAGVSIEAFLELFADKQECFLAAFDTLGDELLRIVADPELLGENWPRAVRRTIGALLRHLAGHPLQAQMIVAEVFAAGPEAIERDLELAHKIATLLTAGAPEQAGGMIAVEGVAGAIWHTVRCQVASGQIHLLPALADYLTYVVLAPFIGAGAAAELVTADD
jgi:AcrR family transcriptional regulator